MVLYKVHPRGDIILTLHNPNAPFAECASDEDASAKLSNSAAPTDDACETTTEPPKTNATQEELLPKFLLSSSHLTLSSGYFKRMLTGPWKEATSSTESGTYHLSAHDWDEEAFMVLMNIIHGRNRKVPRRGVELEFIAKIAVMVDYYKCHEAVDIWFSEVWEKSLPIWNLKGRDLTMRCFISWVFGQESTFTGLTCDILRQSIGPWPTCGLAFPVDIMDSIEQRRQTLLEQATQCLNDVFVRLRDHDECSFECASMMLGALIKELGSKQLPYPLPEAPYLSYSFSMLYSGTRTCKKVEWLNKYHECRTKSYNSFGGYTEGQPIDKCGCDLTSLIVPAMDRVNATVRGLSLTDFPQSIEDEELEDRQDTNFRVPVRLT